jgi:glycosyltransferase involved in cell wall biosynthesis
MKIALIGTRGVPARYGGFETCVEEIGKRLTARGHEVWVYGRSAYYQERPSHYLGMRVRYLPALNVRSVETLSNTLLALLDAVGRPFDVLLVFNSANSPLLLIPKLLGKKVVLHADGLEWMRGKWNAFGRGYYRWAERVAAKSAIEIIADSREIQRYYRERYGKETHYISYGAEIRTSRDPSVLKRYGLEPEEYFLQITRFEPENNPLLLVKAFEKLTTDKKLVLAGGAKYPTAYSKDVFATKDPRVKFLGFLYDKNILSGLLGYCYAYIHGNEVGGTNPALLEAMASGCFVLARDVPFNREVLGDKGSYFEKDVDDLAARMQWSLDHAPALPAARQAARDVIRSRYDWSRVVEAYEQLFAGLRRD